MEEISEAEERLLKVEEEHLCVVDRIQKFQQKNSEDTRKGLGAERGPPWPSGGSRKQEDGW